MLMSVFFIMKTVLSIIKRVTPILTLGVQIWEKVNVSELLEQVT
jgi:hypothetical protein